MSDIDQVTSIAQLPVQLASDPASPAEARARYFNTGNAFDIRLEPVPDRIFTDEPAKAHNPDTPTSFIPCDISKVLGCPFPATSPLILARYARIRPGESLAATFNASGVVIYVIAGTGSALTDTEEINWGPGDIVLLAGGIEHRYRATGKDAAVLWIVTNEPQLAFENLRAPGPDKAVTKAVHYTAAEMKKQIELIYRVGRSETIAGSALILASEEQEARRNALPTMTIAMNSLAPGAVQRAHRHNAVAISLIIEGDNCFSMIDHKRKDWAPWATTITPPGALHSHHNEGSERAYFLIIQDGGLYYHTRAMGFAFEDE